jgi:hypothetical protein
MSDVTEILTQFVKAYCANEQIKRLRRDSITRHEYAIAWIENILATRELTPKQCEEYKHQIRQHEINLAFLYAEA